MKSKASCSPKLSGWSAAVSYLDELRNFLRASLVIFIGNRARIQLKRDNIFPGPSNRWQARPQCYWFETLTIGHQSEDGGIISSRFCLGMTWSVLPAVAIVTSCIRDAAFCYWIDGWRRRSADSGIGNVGIFWPLSIYRFSYSTSSIWENNGVRNISEGKAAASNSRSRWFRWADCVLHGEATAVAIDELTSWTCRRQLRLESMAKVGDTTTASYFWTAITLRLRSAARRVSMRSHFLVLFYL